MALPARCGRSARFPCYCRIPAVCRCLLTVIVPVVPRSGPRPASPGSPPRGGLRPDGEASRNPCEGHPDRRAASLAARYLTVSDEKPRRRFYWRSRSATGRIFMLQMQQRQIRVLRCREAIVPALILAGRAVQSREHAPLPFNHNPAASRLAPSTVRERAFAPALVRFQYAQQNADRCDPPGGDPGRGFTRQSRRGIRLRKRQPQAASR